ncbi:MAG: methionyl-tRNA formyltransferase [Candidatus Eremiobacteraeota bacterium]|nr:methionyl-tRNA formyltransferase [Candidatus Eremiobacteraeota bacterium]
MRVTAARTTIAGVVTQPDRRSGRGQRLQPTPVKLAAQELGLLVCEPESLRDFAAELTDDIALFVLASYGKILPGSLLRLPALGALNVHPSLLPLYRGATPLQSALREGASQTGVTIMLMDAGMDTGDVVLQEKTPVDPNETYGELHDRLAELGARLLERALEVAAAGTIVAKPQRGEPTITRPLSKADLRLDWNWDSDRIVNTVRAFSPQPGARADVLGVPVKIVRAVRAGAGTGQPGTVLGIAGDAVTIATGAGAVNVVSLIPANRGPMSGAAFASSFTRQTP